MSEFDQRAFKKMITGHRDGQCCNISKRRSLQDAEREPATVTGREEKFLPKVEAVRDAANVSKGRTFKDHRKVSVRIQN